MPSNIQFEDGRLESIYVCDIHCALYILDNRFIHKRPPNN